MRVNMNLKLEALKGCIFILIGAYLCSILHKPKVPEVQVKQEQSCETVLTKTTDKNGIVTEKVVFKASQAQEVKPTAKANNMVFLGIATDKKANVTLVLDKWSHEIRTDFNKDHVYQLSYKVLEF